jgi:hypothetical protein
MVEALAAYHQNSISTKAMDYLLIETEQLDLSLRYPRESHDVEIAVCPLEQANTNGMILLSNSGEKIEVPTQEVIANKDPDTRSGGTVTNTPHRSSLIGKQNPESVLNLELKLFKYIAIRVVPQATPLKPMCHETRSFTKINSLQLQM